MTRVALVVVLAACHSEYELVPLTCGDPEGVLSDLRFTSDATLSLRADVLCVDPDAELLLEASRDEVVFPLRLTGCERQPNEDESSKIDLVGCRADALYGSFPAGCVPIDVPASGTTLRLVEPSVDAELDDLFVPVDVLGPFTP